MAHSRRPDVALLAPPRLRRAAGEMAHSRRRDVALLAPPRLRRAAGEMAHSRRPEVPLPRRCTGEGSSARGGGGTWGVGGCGARERGALHVEGEACGALGALVHRLSDFEVVDPLTQC